MLVSVADRFNLKGLRALSVHFLGKNLNADNVVDVYLEATDKLPELGKYDNWQYFTATAISSLLPHVGLSSNCISWYSLNTFVWIAENIQELCTNFMSKNMANVVKTKSFCDLSQITLLTIIQRTANLRIN